MGVYDILPDGGQVKCWGCEMKHLSVGSRVGKLDGEKNYIVLLREGGYVKIIKRKIDTIEENGFKYLIMDLSPLPIFDKYGNRIYSTFDLKDIFGEEYYF